MGYQAKVKRARRTAKWLALQAIASVKRESATGTVNYDDPRGPRDLAPLRTYRDRVLVMGEFRNQMRIRGFKVNARTRPGVANYGKRISGVVNL